jgi:hypothetical protein
MLSFLAKNWFPLVMIALFIAVVPGVALVILAALSLADPVNDWLLEQFQITYHLAMPPLLLLILLLVPLAIIILYFLKLKRKPLQVPSTFLWRKSIEDLHVNSLLQWLRQNLLLVLQLLVVLFLIYSTLGLRFHGASSKEGQHYIILIDNSASMSARDVKPTRLEWSKAEALKVIDAASDNDNGMIIAFNSKATTVQAYTNNRVKLREAVNSIEQTARTTRFEEPLTLVDGLANPSRSTEDAAVRPEDVPAGKERQYVPPKGIHSTIHLFSDGRFPRPSKQFLDTLNASRAGLSNPFGDNPVIYHMTGKDTPGKANNLAIVGFNAVRDKNQGLQAHVRVRNFRAEQAEATLMLDMFVNGELVHSEPPRKLTIEGRTFKAGDPENKIDDEDTPGEAQAIFQLQMKALDPKSNIFLHARLDQADDEFAMDNEAWFVVPRPRMARVMLVGPANSVLDFYFQSARDKGQASLLRLSAADLTTDAYRKPARSGEVDLVIFDRCAPEKEEDMPLANTFFIDRPPPPWQRGDKVKKSPLVLTTRANDRFLYRITSLWDVGVAEAFVFDLKNNLDDRIKKLPDDDVNRRLLPVKINRILEADKQVPLLFTLPREPYTDLVMTFAIFDDQGNLNTNWPHKRSFTLFVYNVVNNLGNVESAGHMVQMLSVPPGEPMMFRPDADVKSLTVRSPGGTETVLQRGNRPDLLFGATEKPGIYSVFHNGSLYRYVAVNLLDSSESAIDPRADLGFRESNIQLRQSETSEPRELWKWILMIALVLLVAEWFFFNQRVSI